MPATAAGRAAEPPRPAAPAPPANGAPKEAPAAAAQRAARSRSAPAASDGPPAAEPARREPARSGRLRRRPPPTGRPPPEPVPARPAPEPSVAAVAVIEPEGSQEPVVAAVGLDLDAFAELWPAIIESIQAERPLLAEHLKVARPAALGQGELTLAWAETHGLSKRKAEDAANRELIGRAIRAVTGASLRLAHELRAEAAEEEQATLSADELIERFVEEFEAEILPEEDPEETS